MLVISRKLGEKISIKVGEEEIEVLLVQIKGKQIRLGIGGDPDKVKIERYENLNTERAYDGPSN